jgi:5-oxoprolinase (ATP-hydrolysing) subunit C
MTGRLRILGVGPGATLQDGGRDGYLRYGVSASGPMDWLAHAKANLLAGNPEKAGAIEVGLGGIELEAEGGDFSLGYAGGAFTVQRNGRALASIGCIRLAEGDRFSAKAGPAGAWFYISPAGGLDVAPVMGSIATSLRSGVGGFAGEAGGRALAMGDKLALRAPRQLPELRLEERASGKPGPIRVLLGPQDDYFSAKGLATFFGEAYRLSSRSDRMGYRLDGPPVEHAKGFNIVSDGIALGAIQIPGDGKPIVLMAERQTTGGYPKLGHVIRADIGWLAQTRPGENLRFAAVTIDAARTELFAALSSLRATFAAASPLGQGDFSSEFLLAQNLISGAQNAAD